MVARGEGRKRAADSVPETFWEQVIGGTIAYVTPPPGAGVALAERTSLLGFDAAEVAILRRIFQISDLMKQVEQIAFAATQGLYDPVKREFVSEAEPQREFASALLHEARYLKLRAELGLDRSVLEQFGIYVMRVLEGDLGTSWQTTMPSSSRDSGAFWKTCTIWSGPPRTAAPSSNRLTPFRPPL